MVKRKDRKREGEGREFSIHVVFYSQVPVISVSNGYL